MRAPVATAEPWHVVCHWPFIGPLSSGRRQDFRAGRTQPLIEVSTGLAPGLNKALPAAGFFKKKGDLLLQAAFGVCVWLKCRFISSRY
jgi:hypothetical protein